jgi:starch synthase
MKILHAAAECVPLAKTGGLADVVAALPPALQKLDADVRVCIPAYRGAAEKLRGVRTLVAFDVLRQRFEILEGTLPGNGCRVWLVHHAPLYAREGDPYRDATGREFADNAWRFGCFGEAVARLAAGAAGWVPDVAHLHDWQPALAAPRLMELPQRPRLVFTIHNLAYQGVFGRDAFDALQLPPHWWQIDGVEYWGGFSFMKAGLNYADAITTVSPTYAREICTPAFGHSLDGLLRARASQLHGIVNGIDDEAWNPATDAMLDTQYHIRNAASGKAANKRAVCEEIGLKNRRDPLAVFIGRLTDQKGADLIVAAGEALKDLPVQIIVLGAGDRALQDELTAWASAARDRVAVRIGYDERLAHRLYAAADLLLMPSRFEPCGLNQMYAQRYGAIPVVRHTGGLADTVTNATPEALADGSATGVHFEHADADGLLYGVRRALELFGDGRTRMALRRSAMKRDFSWDASARRYMELYRELCAVSSSP